MKTCSQCGNEKPLIQFRPLKSGRDGLHPECKECLRKRSRERYASNKEKVLAANKKWREENRERVKEINTRSRLKNAEKVKVRREASKEWAARYNKDYREKNKEKIKENRKEYHRSHKTEPGYLAVRRVNCSRRRARMINAIPPWVDTEKVKAVYAHAAFLRSIGVDCHVDHIVPLRGRTVSGLHWHGNLQILFPEENHRKSNKMPDEQHLRHVAESVSVAD